MDLIPSHDVAVWLIDVIDDGLEWIGLGRDAFIEELVYVAVIVAGALIVGWLLRTIILFVIKRVIDLRKFEIGKELLAQKVFTRISHIIPPLIFLALIPFTFATSEALMLRVLNGAVKIYLSVTIGVAICAVLSFLWKHYDNHRNDKNHPLRGVLIVAQGVVWILITIITVSGLLGKSPIVLLTGLGAFAAALMLIFKDSILGFVAGVQLSQNDMLRVGDWIVVPSTIANGVVEDVSLTVVKVRNWDNTLVMMPPYTLVSTSFQNWRGMSEVGVRLMSGVIIIDNNSVAVTSDGLKKRLISELPSLSEIVACGVTIGYNSGNAVVNGSVATNLGLFRAYLCQYLIKHTMISNQWQILVNLLNGDSSGQPLQIYCYVATADWTIFEAVKSEVLEHAIASARKFDLSVYNSVAGIDLRKD